MNSARSWVILAVLVMRLGGVGRSPRLSIRRLYLCRRLRSSPPWPTNSAAWSAAGGQVGSPAGNFPWARRTRRI